MIDINVMVSEGMVFCCVRWLVILVEDNVNDIEELDINELNVNEVEKEVNLKGLNFNEFNLNEVNLDVLLNLSINDKGKDEEEERRIDEIFVDDGSLVNILILLYVCVFVKVF